MALITWGEQFSVGIAAIDTQHRKLIDLMNELHEAMRSGKAREVLGGVLGELVKYTLSHFAAEERMMQQAKYGAYLPHKAEHEKFVAQVATFQADFLSGKSALTIETMTFLKDWLQHHILGTDKQYAPVLQGKKG